MFEEADKALGFKEISTGTPQMPFSREAERDRSERDYFNPWLQVGSLQTAANTILQGSSKECGIIYI